MIEVHIRPERPEDVDAITRVTELAFRSQPHSDRTEHLIVLALRRAGALSVSLVAEIENQVVGHVAFSPVQISDSPGSWYGLGPVSVLPELQNQGIGTALINRGLSALRELGAAGCVVLGEPSYYRPFGFKNKPDCVFDGVPQEYFQVLEFGCEPAVGKVTYHEAFGAKG